MLDEAVAWIEANSEPTDSFIVSHCGQTLVSTYQNGFDADMLHELQSATKTFSAVLVGIALDQGLIESVDQPLVELLPDYADLLTGEKAEITLRHVLTMTTGLRWVDFGANNSFVQIGAAEDSVVYVLEQPLLAAPGETFFYNTGSSHLLSAIIHHNSGMTTAEFAEAHLFEPLGIEAYQWPALRDGVQQGGWGMYMKPADFLKFGELLLNGGRWQGEQVVSRAFVDDATAFLVPNGMGGGYGYQMWIDTNTFDVDDIAGARGYGGQDCLVMAELGLVVVFTGDIIAPAQMAQDVATVVNRFVIPAYTGP